MRSPVHTNTTNDFLQRTCGREFIFSCVQRQRGRFRLIPVTDTKFRHHQSTAVRLDEHIRTALPTDSQSQNDCCTGCQCDRLIIITSPPWVGANQCNQRVCLSVCLFACLKPDVQTSRHFLCMLLMRESVYVTLQCR